MTMTFTFSRYPGFFRHPGEGRGPAAAKPQRKNLDSGFRRNDGNLSATGKKQCP
jgi:hypothetical protein